MAFHAQQCVEKCFKALLEEADIEIRKTHNLLTLKTAINQRQQLDFDEDMLSLLNKLYIDSRYPGSFGLLPSGIPSLEDAEKFVAFAVDVMQRTSQSLAFPSL